MLRVLLARIYAYAAVRSTTPVGMGEPQCNAFVIGIVEAADLDLPTLSAPKGRLRTRFGGLLWGLFLAAIWFGLVAQIYVGQFLNHRWWSWVNHPLIGLPWFSGPG